MRGLRRAGGRPARYTPHLKGTVETLNAAVKSTFLAGLPRYTAAPRLANGRPANPDAPARFEVFVNELLAWVGWWNTRHKMDVLDGRTPLPAWLGDPTPSRQRTCSCAP